jgi:uncharacterized membrane protein YeaQ/YmgE (transglycosylase-associated protein family)
MNTTALSYALGTVLCWGLYSVLLHKGSQLMTLAGNPDLGSRMKAFLLVGVAYFVVGIVGPMVVMKIKGTPLNFPTGGVVWSFVAGLAGAIGAYFLLMALSSGTSPMESKALVLLVPAIVFAGAPIVNAVVSITKDGVWGQTHWQFYAGIILAAAGVAMVMQYRPLAAPAGAPKPAPAPVPAAVSAQIAPFPSLVPAGSPVTPGYVDVSTRTWSVS